MKRFFGIASVFVLFLSTTLARAGGIGGGIGVYYDPISRTLVLECLQEEVDISPRSSGTHSDYYMNASDFANLQSLVNSGLTVTAVQRDLAPKTDKMAGRKPVMRSYYVVAGDEPNQIRLVDSLTAMEAEAE